MRRLIPYFTAIVILASCSASKSDDPAAELAKLKKERATLDDKIKSLEEEILKNDTTSTNTGELVRVEDVHLRPFVHFIELQGRIDADENVTVTPQMPGIIDHIYVSVGQHVAEGQLLAEIDNDAMKKNIETYETQLAFARDVYNKQKALWDQKIGTEVQYLSAKNNVETLEKSIAAAKEQLEMSKLISPINGIVDAVDIKVGQIASPGYAGIRVVNMSSLKAKGEVSETYSAIVSQGDKAKIILPDMNKEFDATISFTSKVINPQSRTFSAEAKLPGDPALKPNMVALMKIADYENEKAIVVDLNMIHKSADADFVYVAAMENGKNVAQRRIVKVGSIYNGEAEIVSGLSEGDHLIVAGYQDLIAGQEITF